MSRVLLMITTVLFVACSQEKCRETVDPLPVSLEVERIDQELFQAQTAQEIESILQKRSEFAEFFLDSDQYPSKSLLADRMFNLLQNPSIDTLYNESLEAFNKLDEMVGTMELSLGRLKQYFPQTKTPKVQLAVTGLYKDLFISNDHIMIGMDFFIGEGASYKPQQIPDYLLRRYTTEHLPANIIHFISSQFITQTKGETMLSDMIDHGKSYYLLSKLLPCTPENILIGYTEEEWSDSKENDEIIWANFIDNELLFETNHQMKQKFIGERPNVYEIGEKCPGRIGRWLGWQIVKSYVEKTGASVQTLMKETDANEIFKRSEYKPGQ